MAEKTQVFPPPKEENNLEELAEEESRILFDAKSVFPFSLFPDKIIIHPNKIDVVIGEFFKSDYVRSFLLQDIGGVDIVTTPFMATVRIAGNKMGLEPVHIKNLKRKDAIKAKEIIDGLMIMLRREKGLGDIKSVKHLPHVQKTGVHKPNK